jgi:hypothetical protein
VITGKAAKQNSSPDIIDYIRQKKKTKKKKHPYTSNDNIVLQKKILPGMVCKAAQGKFKQNSKYHPNKAS